MGSTTTKIVGLEKGQIIDPMYITAADPVTSLFGAFGKYLYDRHIAMDEVAQVMLTGVGSGSVETPIYGLPTTRVNEFIADGMGARHLSGLDRLMVVSMGTGTTLVRVDGDNITHHGGIGMGGGTLQGLARQLLGTHQVADVVALAEHGDISHINLQIKDISTADVGELTLNATASLFAKARNGNCEHTDLALGLIWMVLETIGSCAVLSVSNDDIRDFVAIGNLTRLPQCRHIFDLIEQLYGVRFIIPDLAQYSTAIGAALAYNNPQ